jgi:hypothetical protein
MQNHLLFTIACLTTLVVLGEGVGFRPNPLGAVEQTEETGSVFEVKEGDDLNAVLQKSKTCGAYAHYLHRE